ncbi:hypothetical protein EMCRGX_G000512 [Ephydatia muelleri]
MTAETLQRGVRRLFNLSGGAVSQRLPEVVAVLADPPAAVAPPDVPPAAVAPPAVADALLPPTSESADALLLLTPEPLKAATGESLKVKIPTERPPKRHKVEPPKIEEPKAEASKIEEPKATPKESGKVELPRAPSPKVDAGKVELPRAPSPKVDADKVELPRAPSPKVEASKVELPKAKIHSTASSTASSRAASSKPAAVEKLDALISANKSVEAGPKVEASKVELPKAKIHSTASSTASSRAASSKPAAVEKLDALISANKSVEAVSDIEPDVEVRSKEALPPYTKEDEARGNRQAAIEISSMSLQQSTLEGEEVEPPQGDPVTGSGRYRHSSLSLRQSTLEGEEVEPPPRAACHYNSPPWRVKRLNHPQGDPVTGSGCYRHSSLSLRQSTLEGEEVEPPPRCPVTGSGRYRHSSMSLQQSTLEGEEVEPPPRAACHYNSPPWRVKRLNHPQGDPVTGSGCYRHSSLAACHYNSPPWRVKRLNHPQGDPVTGSGRYRHSSLSLRQSTLEGEEVEPPPSPPTRVKRLNHPQSDPVTGSGRYRHSSLSLRQSTLEGEEVEPPPR